MKKNVNFDCDTLSGKRFCPLFGQSLTINRLEELMIQAYSLTANDIKQREEESVIILDWQKDGISYSAGLKNNALVFVNLRFVPYSLNAKQLIGCLGAPQSYQAWYDSYPEINASSIQTALIYQEGQMVAYGSIYIPIAAHQPPELDESLPIVLLTQFEKDWSELEQKARRERPWPGTWKAIEIKSNLR